MYAKARRGEIKGFTGIDDVYEPPLSPEITLDTVQYTSEENARMILNHLIEKGFIESSGKAQASPEKQFQGNGRTNHRR